MNKNLDTFNGRCNAHVAPELVRINLCPGQTFPIFRSTLMPSYRFNSCSQPLTPLKYTLVGSSVSKDAQHRANVEREQQGVAFARSSMVSEGLPSDHITSTDKQTRKIPIEAIPHDGKRFAGKEYSPSMFQEGLATSSRVPSITQPQNCFENDRTIIRAPKTCSPLIRNIRTPTAAIETRLVPVHSNNGAKGAVFTVQPEQLHRLTQGTPVRQPVKLFSVSSGHPPENSSPSNAIKSVREQLERKRKAVSSQNVPLISSSSLGLVKVPRTKSIAPATGVNLPRESSGFKKQNTSLGEIVCLSSDEDSDQETNHQDVDRITIQNIESIGPSENAHTSSESDKTQSTCEKSKVDEKTEDATIDCQESAKMLQTDGGSSKSSPRLNETDFPYLSRNNIDPNCYTPGDVEIKLVSIYCNRNSVVPLNADLSTTFSAYKITLPASMLSVGPDPSNQNRLPKQIKYENIKTITFANMSNFAAVLLSFSTGSSSINELSASSKIGAKALEAILLVLKTPIPEESLNKLMIIFEILNFDRHDTKFFTEDSNCVISHYQKIDPNSFDSRGVVPLASSSKQKNNIYSSIEKSTNSFSSMPQVLYTYKMGKSAISITKEDVKCLRPDEFLNDTIIDFFCNYLLDKHLSPEQRETVHVFSSFFYKTYTQVKSASRYSSTSSSPSTADAGSKTIVNHQIKYRRHDKVKNWTKNVDLFKKDFIFIPVNEDWHWFLVVICYPNRVVNSNSLQTLMLYGKTQHSSETCISTDKFLEDKQPLILVLNSLITGSKANLFKMLKDYLEIEYEAKNTIRAGLSRQLFLHASPNVPQQTNSFDCGLYLLKYLEMFIIDFITVKEHKKINWEKWFETSVTSNMRKKLNQIIMELHLDSRGMTPPGYVPKESKKPTL